MPTFFDLPLEMSDEVLSYLTPEKLLNIASSSHALRKAARHQGLWRLQVERYFPHVFSRFQRRQDIDWYAEFRQTYQREYSGLPRAAKRVFSLVKEGNLESIRHLLDFIA